MKPPPSVDEMQLLPEVDAFIEHYGTKGMKWGVRKRPSTKRGVRGAKNERGERFPKTGDAKKVAELRRREPYQLSNKQIQTVNTRLNLEQNYNKLNPNAIKRGAVAAGAILAAVKTGQKVYKIYKSPQGQAAIKNARRALQANPRLGQQELFFK